MPRDRFGASNIGTFACRTFPCDTKASKRAKRAQIERINCENRIGVTPIANQEVRYETAYLQSIKQRAVENTIAKLKEIINVVYSKKILPKMDKYFCIFLLALSTYSLFGQPSENLKLPEPKRFIDKVEIFAGSSLSFNYGNKFIENYKDDNVTNKRSAKLGYLFGLGIYHPFSNKLSLNIKASFEQKGTKSEFNNTSLLVESEYEYQYFSFFVAPRFIIGKNVFASIGGYYSILKKVEGFEVVYSDPDIFKVQFSGRQIRSLRNDGSVQSITYIPGLQSFARNDYGVSFRLGYLFHLKGNHNITIELVDNFGLKNINKLTDGNLPEKNHNINFVIGYLLNR